MLSEKKVEKAGMKMHSTLFGLFILCFFLPCVMLDCPPQFSGTNGEDFIIEKGVMSIRLKSHTNISSCWIRDLTQEFPQNEVDCKVNGEPPDLTLTLNLTTDWCEEDWTLFINNSIGISNRTFSFRNKTFSYLKFWKTFLFLGSSCVLLVTIFTAAVILCVFNRRPLDESSDCITATGEATTELQAPVGKNSDGLVYGELDFSDKITSDVIIGTVPETQYSNILFGTNADTSK